VHGRFGQTIRRVSDSGKREFLQGIGAVDVLFVIRVIGAKFGLPMACKVLM